MSDSGSSSIKFSLEESVLFKSGQEVDELISISLDPNISIFEEDGFVMLRGSLNLTGEYKRVDLEEEPDETPITGRYVQHVESRDEEECEFFHPFPVDITIPEYRVRHADEVFVQVESFDYVMPESSRLNIEAEVHVYGLQGEQEEDENEEEALQAEQDSEVESTVEVELEEYRDEEPELVERNQYGEEEQEAEQDEWEEQEVNLEGEREEVKKDEQEEDLYAPFAVEVRAAKGDGKPRIPEHYQQNELPHPFQMLPEMDMDEVAERLKGFFKKNNLFESPSASQDESTSSSNKEEVTKKESSSKDSPEAQESPDEKSKKKKKDKYHSMSFADFFARKEEDEPAKLKMRLVQHGDSLETLADKYGVTVQQIMRANRLDPSHEVFEGQVLYIPEKTAYRK